MGCHRHDHRPWPSRLKEPEHRSAPPLCCLQSNCIEAVKSKALQIMSLAPTVHPDAITRLVGNSGPPMGYEGTMRDVACFNNLLACWIQDVSRRPAGQPKRLLERGAACTMQLDSCPCAAGICWLPRLWARGRGRPLCGARLCGQVQLQVQTGSVFSSAQHAVPRPAGNW